MLTAQQTAAVSALLGTTSNLALVARAGCGKTYTIIEMVKAYVAEHPAAEIAVAAYNAPIAAEVKAKLEALGFNWRQVQAATAHALGKGLVDFRLNRPKVEKDKVRLIVQAQETKSAVCREHGAAVAKLVRLAKQSAFGYFDDLRIEDTKAWLTLADHYGVDDFEDPEDLRKVIAVAQWVYKRSLEDVTTIDFDDMILLPLIKNIRVRFTKDLVIVDEAQDLSRARQALLKRFVKPGTGRMVVVGDDRQAIYGFSGADAEALPRMISELNATVLPLNVTWRCPKAVVRVAQVLVPDFTAANEAPEGEVINDLAALPDDLSANDAILCRNTAPLITLAYSLLKRKIPCKVEGRSIGEGLANLAQRWKVKTVDALLNKLDTYQDREVKKALDAGKDAKAEAIHDQVGSLRFICEQVLAEKKTAVADVVAFIDTMFGDDVKGVVTLATYHRSKGREWDRVFLLEHATRCPSKFAKKPHELQQEDNLAYVAFTRAKRVLAHFNMPMAA